MDRPTQVVLVIGLIASGCGAPAPTATPSGERAAGDAILMDLTNQRSSDRYLELVTLDAVSGDLRLSPLRGNDGWKADAATKWTASGDALVLGWSDPEGDPTAIEIRRVPLDPGLPAVRIDFGTPSVQDVYVSPDGRWYSARERGNNAPPGATIIARADGSTAPATAPGGGLAWSGDGRRAAILTDARELLVLDPATMTTRVLAQSAGGLTGSGVRPPVVWAPDGSEILFRDADGGLSAVAVESAVVRTIGLEEDLGFVQVVGWSPAGIVVYRLGEPPADVLLISPDDGTIRTVLAAATGANSYDLSPDLVRLAVLELDAGSWAVLVIDLGGGETRRFAAPEGSALSFPRWQPAQAAVPWPAWTPPSVPGLKQ